jgi:trehalose synthase
MIRVDITSDTATPSAASLMVLPSVALTSEAVTSYLSRSSVGLRPPRRQGRKTRPRPQAADEAAVQSLCRTPGRAAKVAVSVEGAMRQVTIEAERLDALAPVLGPSRFAAFEAMANQAAATLAGRAILHVNSTATGGGVAEMLQCLLAYARGIGLDVRWLAIDGTPAFFDVTKRIHNNIYGVDGDSGRLGRTERSTYESVLGEQRDELLALVHPDDVVVLHDPQTLGLAPALADRGARVVWRSHIGADAANEFTAQGWAFVAPYLADVDLVVVSRSSFAPPGFPADRVQVIAPSIDPRAVKNVDLDERTTHAVLAYAGLVQDGTVAPPVFHRRDGSPARVDRRADIVQLGPPPPYDAPLVVQVSRWDRLKDMPGVLQGYADHVDGRAHLLLVGPNVTGVADDPGGAAVFEECVELWRRLPHAQRQHVHLACLPTADVEENAVIVNALQRHARVVTQKSLAEGFGLTVAEAMWKGTPVVASAVGGIVDQITDACGVLLPDPSDLSAFGTAVRDLIEHPQVAEKMGAAARERAADFLPDVHLARWASVLSAL